MIKIISASHSIMRRVFTEWLFIERRVCVAKEPPEASSIGCQPVGPAGPLVPHLLLLSLVVSLVPRLVLLHDLVPCCMLHLLIVLHLLVVLHLQIMLDLLIVLLFRYIQLKI
jgi:hypothetical protein